MPFEQHKWCTPPPAKTAVVDSGRSSQEERIVEPNWRALVVGGEKTVPAHGGARRYTNLDNAASTPPLVSVRDSVFEFLEWYASVHRGNGFKSRLSTWLYETTRETVAEFFGAD